MTTLTVSVVSGRDPALVEQFLRSLWCDARRSSITLRTTVVMNAPDEFPIVEAWGEVDVIRNAEPQGFAHNHNVAIARGVGDFHLLSNDDVVVHEGTLERLIAFLNDPANARVGAVCPQLTEPDGTIQGSTYAFPSLARAMLPAAGIRRTRIVDRIVRRGVAMFGASARGRTVYAPHDETLLVDTVRGAFVMMRGATIREIGPMDEVSLVGGEDLEWHRRMLDHGWRVAFYPGASVTHIGRSTRGDDPVLHLEALKGLFNYFHKYGRENDVTALRAVLGASSVVRMASGKVTKRDTEAARKGWTLARTWRPS